MKSTMKKALLQKCPFKGFFLYALSGILFALPLAYPALWLLSWVAPVFVLYRELYSEDRGSSYLRAYGRGFSFFFFFGIIVFSWFLSLYPLDFLGFDNASSAIIVALGLLGLPLVQAFVSSLVFPAVLFIKKRGFAKSRPFLTAIFTACLFSIAEYCHTLTFLGVPWGRLAVGQTGCLANIQSASLFGSYFITFLIVLTASLTALSISHLNSDKKRMALVSFCLAILIFLSNLAFGAVKIALFTPSGEKVSAAAVQGNILYEEKWADKAGHTMDVYRDLSLMASEAGAELIVLPETALPYDINESVRLSEYFSLLAKDCDSTIIATAFERVDYSLYNTARLAYPDGSYSSSVYKKQHLVPFGEYTPLLSFIEKVFPPLAEMSALEDAVTPGDSSNLLSLDGHLIGSLICFDSIYENLCLESVRDGAELICISTNDSWFSESRALSQHNAQAALRAIENGRYVIRSANTGISSFISPTGEVLNSIGDGEEGFILSDVHYTEKTTLYTKTGNILVYASMLLVFSVLSISAINHKKRKSNHDHSHNS